MCLTNNKCVIFSTHSKRDGGQQWQHPELSQISRSMESEYNQPCYPNMAYPAALKLRNLQKRTQRESFFLFSTTSFCMIFIFYMCSHSFIIYTPVTFFTLCCNISQFSHSLHLRGIPRVSHSQSPCFHTPSPPPGDESRDADV